VHHDFSICFFLHFRNVILSLWNKDVKHLLGLAECGVSDLPSKNESPCQTLIRDVYLFLDQNVSWVAYNSWPDFRIHVLLFSKITYQVKQ
jgi:hypothetical protein